MKTKVALETNCLKKKSPKATKGESDQKNCVKVTLTNQHTYSQTEIQLRKIFP